MIVALIYLLVAFLVLGVIYWITTLFPLPHPLPLIIQVVIVVIGVLILVNFLLGIAGGPVVSWR